MFSTLFKENICQTKKFESWLHLKNSQTEDSPVSIQDGLELHAIAKEFLRIDLPYERD